MWCGANPNTEKVNPSRVQGAHLPDLEPYWSMQICEDPYAARLGRKSQALIGRPCFLRFDCCWMPL